MVIISPKNTIEEIEAAYHIAAIVVSKYGDKYFPLLKRLHEETQRLKEDLTIKQLAFEVAPVNIRNGDKNTVTSNVTKID